MRIGLGFAGIAALADVLCFYFKWDREWRYPFGWSHCCDKGLYFSLINYAETHGGLFPAGESSPEASLSLLYPDDSDAGTLRGKIVPEDTVTQILESGGRLTPETCGWQYVEGLTRNDNPKLALFWDKAGLGHNGERLDGYRTVTLISGEYQSVPLSEWADFLKAQQALLDARPDAAKNQSP